MSETPMERLADLKVKLGVIEAEINLIEAGLSRAAYDGSIRAQLVAINDERANLHLPKLTLSEFLASDGDE